MTQGLYYSIPDPFIGGNQPLAPPQGTTSEETPTFKRAFLSCSTGTVVIIPYPERPQTTWWTIPSVASGLTLSLDFFEWQSYFAKHPDGMILSGAIIVTAA